ncbi:MAG: RdgB/HAM1 family non-canonical purine NTP pyrophosphatase [Candidatus Omnitrophica bacterium]|nr:RdgB/HAM1 family non-canonical purine NTP pyrophosphatase [Candidatus Omnitrophota bacterium]
MILTFYLATKNKNKISEIQDILKNTGILVKPAPADIVFPEETGESFQENALIKARHLKKFIGKEPVAGEDAGLVVEKLGNLPGVLSARFAGEPRDDRKNIERLLELLLPYKEIKDRKAKFIAVVALIDNNEEKTFRGEVDGFITFTPRGNNGFGYDPVFEILSIGKTFAELTKEEKDRISHRAIAFRKLADYMLNKVK